MTLLELITQAVSAVSENSLVPESNFPITLNPHDAYLTLKPQLDQNHNPDSLVEPVNEFKISQTDTEVIKAGQKFFKKLKRKLKNTTDFGACEFIEILTQFLEKIGRKSGIKVDGHQRDNGYACKLIEKMGFFMGRDVAGLVLEACIVLEKWNVLESLIVHGFVENLRYSYLVTSLVSKKRSDLICTCVKHVSDLRSPDLVCILKYFLTSTKGSYGGTMETVRREWENQALLAIKKATDKSLGGKKSRLANEAAILLMAAYDGFSDSELCLHYLLPSGNLDELILTDALSKLNGDEMMGLIRYLGKWIKKYERFPQACPCPKASSSLGLNACDWVPALEDIVKCLGLVLDEHFPSLVLHPEFHEELSSIDGLVSSLTVEAKLCSSLANVVGNLRA